MPALHENYPQWFNAHWRPRVGEAPSKRIKSRRATGVVAMIEDGSEIDHEAIFKKDKRYCLEVDRGYDGDPSTYTIEEFVEEEIDNPYYQNNLDAHNDTIKKAKEWDILKERWDKEEYDWITEVEKQTLKKLKAKYET